MWVAPLNSSLVGIHKGEDQPPTVPFPSNVKVSDILSIDILSSHVKKLKNILTYQKIKKYFEGRAISPRLGKTDRSPGDNLPILGIVHIDTDIANGIPISTPSGHNVRIRVRIAFHINSSPTIMTEVDDKLHILLQEYSSIIKFPEEVSNVSDLGADRKGEVLRSVVDDFALQFHTLSVEMTRANVKKESEKFCGNFFRWGTLPDKIHAKA
jgi:hypothetical protein